MGGYGIIVRRGRWRRPLGDVVDERGTGVAPFVMSRPKAG
jgi:hypothetical protein